MSRETIYRCAKCNSERVQRLKLCWVDANGDADVRSEDVDHDSDPGLRGFHDTYCRDCKIAGLGIVECAVTPIVTCVVCGNVCPDGVAWSTTGDNPHCCECAGFAPMALNILRVFVDIRGTTLSRADLVAHAADVLAKVERYREGA